MTTIHLQIHFNNKAIEAKYALDNKKDKEQVIEELKAENQKLKSELAELPHSAWPYPGKLTFSAWY